MILLLGIIAGVAYGSSASAGAFMALPLLVMRLGVAPQAALPVALSGLALCAAIAAGDAARMRQCDTRLALALALGGGPVVIAGAWCVQVLSEIVLVTVFATAAVAAGLWLLRVSRVGHMAGETPAALLTAPRRPLIDATAAPAYPKTLLLRMACVGMPSGVAMTLCAAPAAGWLSRRLERVLPGQAFQIAGTMALAIAILATIAAATQFALAPSLSGYQAGYTAGLYVLGTVAGMGLARRIHKPYVRPWAARAVGVGVVVLAGILWVVGGHFSFT